MTQGYSVDINAKKFSIVCANDNPIKIKFLDDNDYLLAEFYTDRIRGE